MLCCAVLCCAVLCCAVLCGAALRCAALCRAVPCRAVASCALWGSTSFCVRLLVNMSVCVVCIDASIAKSSCCLGDGLPSPHPCPSPLSSYSRAVWCTHFSSSLLRYGIPYTVSVRPNKFINRTKLLNPILVRTFQPLLWRDATHPGVSIGVTACKRVWHVP